MRAGIRAKLAEQFFWPPALGEAARPLWDLSAVMDLAELTRVAAMVCREGEITFTIISKEYLQTGLNWIHAMQRLGMANFFIIAGDKFTSEQLAMPGIHCVTVDLDEGGLDPSFVSHDGFSAKGLAMIALKFPVASFLLESGYDVVFSDADAIWLRDPMPYVRDAHVAFQRVAYHPAPIAPLWGFTACSGFVSFKHGTGIVSFLARCIEEQRLFRCDQVAMNLALLEGDPDWHSNSGEWTAPVEEFRQDKTRLQAAFANAAACSIECELRQDGLRVLALPHDKFWRHQWVTSPVRDVVICHPNSPKNDAEKMKIFRAMGICFSPSGPVAPDV